MQYRFNLPFLEPKWLPYFVCDVLLQWTLVWLFAFSSFFPNRFIQESIPWLVAKGRIRQAKEILEKAANMNKVTLPDKYKLTEEEEKLLQIIVSCHVKQFSLPKAVEKGETPCCPPTWPLKQKSLLVVQKTS